MYIVARDGVSYRTVLPYEGYEVRMAPHNVPYMYLTIPLLTLWYGIFYQCGTEYGTGGGWVGSTPPLLEQYEDIGTPYDRIRTTARGLHRAGRNGTNDTDVLDGTRLGTARRRPS